MDFVERLFAAQRSKQTVAILGVDPQLDSKTTPGIPPGYTLARFCCEIVEACAPHIAAITATSSRVMSIGAVEEMLRILRGEDPINLANPGYRKQQG